MTWEKKSLFSFILSIVLFFASWGGCLAASNITLSIQNGQIRDVIAALSSISGQSIITDDSVKGTISIDLNNIPFDSALDLITRSKGLGYKVVNGVIVVSSFDNINKFFGSVSVYKLNYAKAAEVLPVLKGVIKSEGLTSDPITNSLIFSGNAGEEQKLRDALKQLDVATKQITLEAKIIALDDTSSKEIGLQWEWGKIPSNTSDDSGYGGVLHLGLGYQTSFQGTLTAMIASGKGKILATPRIITIPGKQASIFIGDHIPVQTEKRTNGEASVSTEYVDAGIKLSYTPIVSADGFITSIVHTEVSTPTLVSEIKNYKITSRTADTNVRMRNGETLVIGGLINEDEQKNIQKIPLLSNIPLLGELFKFRSTKKTKTEVMMILTPYVTEAGESPAIYNKRIMNTTLTPVPGSDAEEDAKAVAREDRRTTGQKNDIASGVENPQGETFKERIARIMAERNAKG